MAGASMGVAGGMAGGMAPQGGAGFAPPAGAAPKGATTQDTVMAYFQSYAHNDIGCTIANCVEAMAPQGVTDAQVRTAVDNLVNEGHLYSTIDDEHYKATA
jgi:replication factor A2